MVGVDPGLATAGLVVSSLARELLLVRSLGWPCVPQQKRRKLALSKSEDTERRLHRLWLAVEDELSQLLRVHPGAQFRCMSIEGLGGFRVDTKSAMAAGVFRALGYSFGAHVVSWAPMELRARFQVKKKPSKLELFTAVSRHYEVSGFEWTEHSQDALCMVEAGIQVVKEMESFIGNEKG